MAEHGGGRWFPAAAFLSTHPANASRIQELQRQLDRTLPLYQTAGRHPGCQAPAGA